MFIACYALAFWDLTTAMWASLAALFLRQIGHAILEPPCHDKEALLLGFNTPSKTAILATYILIPVVHLVARHLHPPGLRPTMAATVARQWFLWTLGRRRRPGRLPGLEPQRLQLALVWFVKLVTDPLTDLIAYSPRYLRRA